MKELVKTTIKAEESKQFDLDSFLRNLPNLPGVYRYFNNEGQLLYVGKARNLKRRVLSYFQKNLAPRTRLMVGMIAYAEITVVNSEAEALILESNLIKTQNPRFNIVFRDDKSYPYLKLSTESFPRISYYRGAVDKRNSYFGPYPNANAVKDTINVLQKVFRLRTCENSVFKSRTRPCLLYQIGRCSGPCCQHITEEQYRINIERAYQFLKGGSSVIQKDLHEKMLSYAENLEFEKAAVIRDQLSAISDITHSQHMESTSDIDVDIIAIERLDGEICVNLAMVRGGRHLGDHAQFPNFGKHDEAPTDVEILEAFVNQHYADFEIPQVIVTNVEENLDATEELLTVYAGKKINLVHRPINERRVWLDLAKKNAQIALVRKINEKTNQVHRISELVKVLQLPLLPEEYNLLTIECFDISHTSGEATQASCVVFNQNRMDTSRYRRFNITGVTPGDDYSAMRQVLSRHYQKVVKGEAQLPTIVLVDGGRGQVRVATDVFNELGLDTSVIIGVAKGEGRKVGLEQLIFSDPEKTTLYLGKESAALMLIAQIRDEAHRFAITGMRAKRAKAKNYSRIEDLEGIGPKRRQKILAKFGSLKSLSNASIEDIASVPGISKKTAESIYLQLHGQK